MLFFQKLQVLPMVGPLPAAAQVLLAQKLQVLPMVGPLPSAAHQRLHHSVPVPRFKTLPVRAAALRKPMLQAVLRSLQALQTSSARRLQNRSFLHLLGHQI